MKTKTNLPIGLRLVESAIRLAMLILRLVVQWRMRRSGFYKIPGTHMWTTLREKISPADPTVSVSVHEGKAIKDLVASAVVSIYYKQS